MVHFVHFHHRLYRKDHHGHNDINTIVDYHYKGSNSALSHYVEVFKVTGDM